MKRRDVVRVSPNDMVTHLVAVNLPEQAAAVLVRLGRQRESTDLYGHVPAGTIQSGERWRRGLRRLGITTKERLVA
jgi:hypothetical protein